MPSLKLIATPTDPTKSIQMGDTVVVTMSDGATTFELTGIIRQYDYGNGNILLEDTVTDFLHLIKDYLHFYKDLSP